MPKIVTSFDSVPATIRNKLISFSEKMIEICKPYVSDEMINLIDLENGKYGIQFKCQMPHHRFLLKKLLADQLDIPFDCDEYNAILNVNIDDIPLPFFDMQEKSLKNLVSVFQDDIVKTQHQGLECFIDDMAPPSSKYFFRFQRVGKNLEIIIDSKIGHSRGIEVGSVDPLYIATRQTLLDLFNSMKIPYSVVQSKLSVENPDQLKVAVDLDSVKSIIPYERLDLYPTIVARANQIFIEATQSGNLSPSEQMARVGAMNDFIQYVMPQISEQHGMINVTPVSQNNPTAIIRFMLGGMVPADPDSASLEAQFKRLVGSVQENLERVLKELQIPYYIETQSMGQAKVPVIMIRANHIPLDVADKKALYRQKCIDSALADSKSTAGRWETMRALDPETAEQRFKMLMLSPDSIQKLEKMKQQQLRPAKLYGVTRQLLEVYPILLASMDNRQQFSTWINSNNFNQKQSLIDFSTRLNELLNAIAKDQPPYQDVRADLESAIRTLKTSETALGLLFTAYPKLSNLFALYLPVLVEANKAYTQSTMDVVIKPNKPI